MSKSNIDFKYNENRDVLTTRPMPVVDTGDDARNCWADDALATRAGEEEG